MAYEVGHIMQVSLRCLLQGQQAMNVWQYRIDIGSAGVNGAGWGEAWWNHVKTNYRAVAAVEFTGLFRSVFVEDLTDPAHPYGEYAIPVGEQSGTRVSSGGSELLPPFVAAPLRLTVGSSVTRPGQKRLFGFVEGDNVSGYIGAGAAAAINTLAAQMIGTMVLGIPAAFAELEPVIVRKDGTGAAVASQEITGFIAPAAFTSQVSRKFGRGA